MLAAATTLLAADNGDFYENIYRRGVVHFNEGRFDAAQRELRIASFGSLESIPRFETTNAYLVVAARELKQDDEARIALQKILNAEKVTRTFASLPLPAELRTKFDAAANALLTREQRAALRDGARNATAAPAPAPAMTVAPPPQPVAPAPAPVSTMSSPAPAPQPVAAAPAMTAPRTATESPRPTITPTPPPAPRTETVVITEPLAPVDVASQLRTGDAALIRSDLGAARAAYARALSATAISHAEALRLAEGFYRARDFRNVVAAFGRAGALTRGEEPYRYYLAIAYYETGQYAAAKRELAAVLPFIEETPDVARYRSRIEAAIE